METALYIFLGLIGLSVLVTVHEGGHFLAARWAGVDVEAFALGWGKILWRWKPGNTEYRICLLPLGGYCKMKGEQDLRDALEQKAPSLSPAQGSLFGVAPWKRIIISLAGPFANLLMAFVLLSLLAVTGIPQTAPAPKLLLASNYSSDKTFSADEAGLRDGDLVLSVDGKPIYSFSDLQSAILTSKGLATVWQIDREGQISSVTVKPKLDPTEGRPLVGVYPWVDPVVSSVHPDSIAELAGVLPHDRILSVGTTPVRTTEDFIQAVTHAKTGITVTVQRKDKQVDLLWVPDAAKRDGLSFVLPTFPAHGKPLGTSLMKGGQETFHMLTQLVGGLVQLLTGKVNAAQALSGPIRITYYVGEVASQGFLAGWGQGWGAVGNFLAFINLALFFMNLLPIPALDGGTVVITAIEGIRRRRPSVKALLRYQQVGVFFILGLVLFSTFNDVGFLFGLK